MILYDFSREDLYELLILYCCEIAVSRRCASNEYPQRMLYEKKNKIKK